MSNWVHGIEFLGPGIALTTLRLFNNLPNGGITLILIFQVRRLRCRKVRDKPSVLGLGPALRAASSSYQDQQTTAQRPNAACHLFLYDLPAQKEYLHMNIHDLFE